MFKPRPSKEIKTFTVDSTDAGKCLLRAKSGKWKGRCLIRVHGITKGRYYKPTEDTSVPWS